MRSTRLKETCNRNGNVNTTLSEYFVTTQYNACFFSLKRKNENQKKKRNESKMWEFTDTNIWWRKGLQRYGSTLSSVLPRTQNWKWIEPKIHSEEWCIATQRIPFLFLSLSLILYAIHRSSHTNIKCEKNQINHTKIPTIWLNCLKRFLIFECIVLNHMLKITKIHFSMNLWLRFLYFTTTKKTFLENLSFDICF